jgi:metal-responsive CopG/Arc/MetJ family transcriptional regulator
MATDLVTFKLDEKFLQEVDAVSGRSGFSSRTDFIRAALRDKVDEVKFKEIYERLGKLKGAGKRKRQTTDAEIHQVREQALQNLIKKKGWKLD